MDDLHRVDEGYHCAQCLRLYKEATNRINLSTPRFTAYPHFVLHSQVRAHSLLVWEPMSFTPPAILARRNAHIACLQTTSFKHTVQSPAKISSADN